jgi:hypothetical protein
MKITHQPHEMKDLVMPCINLLEKFGKKYRITFDEAYDAWRVHRAKLDPWMMQIPCQGRGVTIYPHGASTLAVEVNRRPSIAAKMMALEGVRLYQDGDTEKTFLFEMSQFTEVAEIVKPRRKRILTEERRKELAGFARQYGFDAQKSTLERAQTA